MIDGKAYNVEIEPLSDGRNRVTVDLGECPSIELINKARDEIEADNYYVKE